MYRQGKNSIITAIGRSDVAAVEKWLCDIDDPNKLYPTDSITCQGPKPKNPMEAALHAQYDPFGKWCPFFGPRRSIKIHKKILAHPDINPFVKNSCGLTPRQSHSMIATSEEPTLGFGWKVAGVVLGWVLMPSVMNATRKIKNMLTKAEKAYLAKHPGYKPN